MSQELSVLSTKGQSVIKFSPGAALVPNRDKLQLVVDLLQGPASALVIVGDQNTRRYAESIDRALSTLVTSEDDFRAASEALNFLGKSRGVVKKDYLAMRRIFDAVGDDISDQAKVVISGIETAEAHLSKELTTFRKMQEQERARAIEAQRLENERKLRETQRAEEEKRRLEAAERLRVEQETQKAERLRWEASQRESAAAKEAELRSGHAAAALDQAVGNPEAFDDASRLFDQSIESVAPKFDKATAVEGQAANVELESAHIAVVAQEKIAELVVPAAPIAHVTAPVPVLTKAKGTAFKRVPIIHSTDVRKLPPEYLVANEVLLKQSILNGLVTTSTPGVVFEIVDVARGTGR